MNALIKQSLISFQDEIFDGKTRHRSECRQGLCGEFRTLSKHIRVHLLKLQSGMESATVLGNVQLNVLVVHSIDHRNTNDR